MRSGLTRFFLALAASLALGLGLFLLVRARRPGVLSMGTIAFAAAFLTAAAAALTMFLLLRRRDSPSRLRAIDAALVVCLAWCWGSFLLAPKDRGGAAQPFLLVCGLSLYFLVRAAGRMLERHRALPAVMVVVPAAAEAARGFSQLISGAEMKGFFFNPNHLAMFLALAVPPALALAWSRRAPLLRGLAGLAAAAFLAAVILTRCRSALAAVVIALGLMFFVRSRARKAARSWAAPACAAAAVALLVFLSVSSKPLSTVGRILTWRVSWRVFLAHPFMGTGYSTFPANFNAAQEDFLGRGLGSAAERLSASAGLYAFNDYLETAVELGAGGLLLFGWLAILILAAGRRALRRPGPGGRADIFDAAAAASLAAYAVISLFYYPSRIMPVFLLFNALLAWVVNAAEGAGGDGGSPFASPFRRFAVAFSAAALLLSAALWPRFGLDCAAERDWAAAQELSLGGQPARALDLCRRAAPRLRQEPQFLVFYSGLLLAQGRGAEAADLLRSSGPAGSNPFVLEKLAGALEQRGELEAARVCALRASRMLPWRLTPEVMIAALDDKLGDSRGATEAALAALDKPMKVRTPEGTELKGRAIDLWLKNRRGGAAAPNPRVETVLLLPAEYRAGALAALDAAGSQAAELMRAVSLVEPSQRAGIGFLLANMPDGDLASLGARFLAEQVKLAYSVRGKLPFAADIPEDVFLNNVLPYAVVGERRDDWRGEFLRRFGPVAARAASLEDAVLDLNLGLIAQYRLTYRERDDRRRVLGPLESIRLGSVSCGEASVLLVDACRAVGIPARLALVGHWLHHELGHTWIEVYDHGRWRHLAAYDAGRLDQTWMEPFCRELDPTDPGQHILASSFRRTVLHGAFGPTVSFEDVTDDYKGR